MSADCIEQIFKVVLRAVFGQLEQTCLSNLASFFVIKTKTPSQTIIFLIEKHHPWAYQKAWT